MSEQKKPRAMTAKGFLHKASKQGVRSAEGFIAQHREWLTTGTLAEVTLPILVKLDAKQIYPTPALEMLSAVVLGHHLSKETAQQEAVEEETAPARSSKRWTATIYNAAGEVQTRITASGDVELLEKSFDLSQEAGRWCDRRLFDGAPDWYGVVVSNYMVNAHGEALSTIIMRQDALARILKKPKTAAYRKTGMHSKGLGFGPGPAHDTRVTFSRG